MLNDVRRNAKPNTLQQLEWARFLAHPNLGLLALRAFAARLPSKGRLYLPRRKVVLSRALSAAGTFHWCGLSFAGDPPIE
jgi:hypothetical protein